MLFKTLFLCILFFSRSIVLLKVGLHFSNVRAYFFHLSGCPSLLFQVCFRPTASFCFVMRCWCLFKACECYTPDCLYYNALKTLWNKRVYFHKCKTLTNESSAVITDHFNLSKSCLIWNINCVMTSLMLPKKLENYTSVLCLTFKSELELRWMWGGKYLQPHDS